MQPTRMMLRIYAALSRLIRREGSTPPPGALPEELVTRILRIQREIATASGNPIEVMQRIAERVVELTEADRAVVGTLDGDDLVVMASSGSTGLRIGDRIAAATGFLAECIRSRRPMPCEVTMIDFTTGEQEASSVFDGGIAIPLLTVDAVTGILIARSRLGQVLSAQDVVALQFLGGLLVSATVSARAVQENQALVRERTQAAERLRQSEQRFRSLIEKSTDAIVVVDSMANTTYVSPAIEGISGFRPGEIMGRGLDLVHSDDIARASEMHKYVLAHPGETVEIEVRGTRKDGGDLYLHCVSTNYLNDPAVGGIVVNVRDITRQRRTQQEQAHLASLVENSHDAIVGWSLEWNVISWNTGATELFGYTAAEAIGMSVSLICPPDQEAHNQDVLERVVRGETVPRFDTLRVHKDGRRLTVSLNLSPIRGTSGDVVGAVAIARDVTEQRRLEGELRQAQKMEAIGRLAGGIAHDFNNILTAISANAELALEALPARSPVREDLAEIGRAGQRAATLTRQLLAFSRKQVLQPQIVDLNSVVSAVEIMLRRVIGEDVTLTTSLAPGLGSVRVDPGQMEQVLMNLVVNSRDAMPSGGSVDIRTELREVRSPQPEFHDEIEPGLYVAVIVSDTGSGMDDATQARIFEPFFTTKDPGRGTGLGLSTVIGIVKQSDGYISVASNPGRGTSFTILLPHLQASHKAPRQDSGEHRELAGGSETILLVEDEESVRAPLTRVLSRLGYDVLEASDGQEALDVASLAGRPIDLLLTDVIMPGMTGRELANRLREIQPDLRIFFMSGYSDDAIATQGEMTAGSAFIEKPFRIHVLLGRVRDLLDGVG